MVLFPVCLFPQVDPFTIILCTYVSELWVHRIRLLTNYCFILLSPYFVRKIALIVCVHVCMRAEICACVPASTATSQQFESPDRFPRNFCVAYYRFILLSPYFVRKIALIACMCVCVRKYALACLHQQPPHSNLNHKTDFQGTSVWPTTVLYYFHPILCEK